MPATLDHDSFLHTGDRTGQPQVEVGSGDFAAVKETKPMQTSFTSRPVLKPALT